MNTFYTAEILALVVALIFFVDGMTQVFGYACEKNHTTISGAFLLLHAVSALLISKKNPYGGKLFWFFK